MDYSILLGKATHPACYLGLGQIIKLFPIMSIEDFIADGKPIPGVGIVESIKPVIKVKRA